MTYAFSQDFARYEVARRPSRRNPQASLCAVALGLCTSVGLWALYARPLETLPQVEVAAKVAPQSVAAPKAAPLPVVAPIPRKAAHRDAALIYPSLTSDYAAATFAQSMPLRAAFAPVRTASAAQDFGAEPSVSVALPVPAVPDLTQDIPLPAPRPSNLLATVGTNSDSPSVPGRRRSTARMDLSTPAVASAAPAAPEGFFEKMFGTSRPAGPALAYAAPDEGGLGSLFQTQARRPGAYDRWTAIYDIEAHTVYLPDGTRLEAHSGLGTSKDNPSSVAERMRGVTPPNFYELTLREAPFHGVRALRLTPVGGTTYGRAGLLAHTYMLRGHSGESNGCVVFKDYNAFLQAYDSGAIKHLAVVARLN